MPWNRLKLVLDPRGFFAAPVNTINRRENDRLLFSLFFFLPDKRSDSLHRKAYLYIVLKREIAGLSLLYYFALIAGETSVAIHRENLSASGV